MRFASPARTPTAPRPGSRHGEGRDRWEQTTTHGHDSGRHPTFQLAFEVAAAQQTGRLVSATYPLARYEDAVAHAGAAGRRGSVKIAFDIAKGDQR